MTKETEFCECCGQVMPTKYPRKIPRAELPSLVQLYIQTAQEPSAWVHKRDFGLARSGGGDFAKLELPPWSLVEQRPNDDDPTKKNSGYWRLTPFGRRWVENLEWVPSHIWIGPQSTPLGPVEGRAKLVRISDIDERYAFDYAELIRNARPFRLVGEGVPNG